MDRLTAMVAIARRRLALRRILVAIDKKLLEGIDMTVYDIRRPMELTGLKSRMQRAKKQDADISVTGKRLDTVMDLVDDLHEAAKQYAGHRELYAGELETFVKGMITASNGDPNDAAGAISEVGQIISSETEK